MISPQPAPEPGEAIFSAKCSPRPPSPLPLVDPEELRIKASDVVDECPPPRYRPARHARLGVVVLIGVPAVGRNFGNQVVAAQQRLPQLLRGVDASG